MSLWHPPPHPPKAENFHNYKSLMRKDKSQVISWISPAPLRGEQHTCLQDSTHRQQISDETTESISTRIQFEFHPEGLKSTKQNNQKKLKGKKKTEQDKRLSQKCWLSQRKKNCTREWSSSADRTRQPAHKSCTAHYKPVWRIKHANNLNFNSLQN